MTTTEYIEKYSAIIAEGGHILDCNELKKEIQVLCGCTKRQAIKTLLKTFDRARKIRETKKVKPFKP